MKIVQSIAEVRGLRRVIPATQRLGLVPTMGALHEGHLSLVRTARSQADVVAATIFVNPTQFGPNEDFSSYPRNFERDRALLEKEKVDLLFVPSREEMYPAEQLAWVTVEGMSDRLCGRSRPGHFRGVTTVVAKLFHILEPDIAFFGQKDAAQLAIIRRMVRDLNLAIEIVGCPIIREPDGLAMSSRNAYLDPKQRHSALALYRALTAVQRLFDDGETASLKLIQAARQVLAEGPGVRIDYIEVADPETLESVSEVRTPVLVAVAAFLGTTRLIDNILLGS
ncbi:MAG TPA: pantoate--beta-alanine ligase [Terriglobales bacterium]